MQETSQASTSRIALWTSMCVELSAVTAAVQPNMRTRFQWK